MCRNVLDVERKNENMNIVKTLNCGEKKPDVVKKSNDTGEGTDRNDVTKGKL